MCLMLPFCQFWLESHTSFHVSRRKVGREAAKQLETLSFWTAKDLGCIGASLLSLIGILCVMLVFCQHPEILIKPRRTQCSMSGVSKSLCFSS